MHEALYRSTTLRFEGHQTNGSKGVEISSAVAHYDKGSVQWHVDTPACAMTLYPDTLTLRRIAAQLIDAADAIDALQAAAPVPQAARITPRHAATPAELSRAWHASLYPVLGIPMDEALTSPDLRPALEGLVTAERRRIARARRGGAGARITHTAQELETA